MVVSFFVCVVGKKFSLSSTGMSAKVLFVSNVVCREIDPISAHFTNYYNKPIIRSLSGRWGKDI